MLVKTATCMGLLPADQLMWCDSSAYVEGVSEQVNGQMNERERE